MLAAGGRGSHSLSQMSLVKEEKGAQGTPCRLCSEQGGLTWQPGLLWAARVVSKALLSVRLFCLRAHPVSTLPIVFVHIPRAQTVNKRYARGQALSVPCGGGEGVLGSACAPLGVRLSVCPARGQVLCVPPPTTHTQGQSLCVPHYLQSSEHLGQVYRAGVWGDRRLADVLR